MQVDAGDGALYYKPVVAGNSTGASVTVVWIKPHLAVYARTWTQTSGCTGRWRAIQTRRPKSRRQPPCQVPRRDLRHRRQDPGHLADDYLNFLRNGRDLLRVLDHRRRILDTAAAAVPDASGTDVTHNMGQLVLDTANNNVWMAYPKVAATFG